LDDIPVIFGIIQKMNIIALIDSKKSYIIGDRFIQIKQVLEKNIYCSKCEKQHQAAMGIKTIEINSLNDILFSGVCRNCGNKVARYLETGENQVFVERINVLRNKLKNN